MNGTIGNDQIAVSGIVDFVTVGGLDPLVRVRSAEPDRDLLLIDTKAGFDDVSTSGLAPNSIQLTVL